MGRNILLVVLSLVIPVTGQAQQSARSVDAGPRLEAFPPRHIPLSVEARLPGSDQLSGEERGDVLLTRLARLYDVQARILEAAAVGDHEQTERLLAQAMAALQELIEEPHITERPRFRDLYRTIVAEYERFYGVPSDSLALPYGDIYAVRSALFDAMNAVEEPLLENVSFPPLGPVASSVPMTMNRLVEQSVSYLVSSPEKHLYHWLSRAQTYFPMIERVLREEGVPDELKYLAMIESGLNPRARSWASANGMWQFMSATGRSYGLQVNSWVDERMDPEKATRAAARHLLDLRDMFDGDWHLALAGYNAGPGRVRSALRRAERRLGRTPTFWDIYNDIPRETRNYVPMFIAASLVASNPAAFNVDVSNVKEGPEYAFHFVPVRGFLSTEEIAELAGTDEATIQALNPELRRSQIPPSKDGYFVRIPIGSYDRFATAYAALPEAKKQSTVTYVVERGDVLGRIARQYGVSVSELMRTNGLRSTTIQIGQRLVVPVPSYDSSPLLAGLGDEDVVTVEYGRTEPRPILSDDAFARRAPARSQTPVVLASTSAGGSTPQRSASTSDASSNTANTSNTVIAEPSTAADAGSGASDAVTANAPTNTATNAPTNTVTNEEAAESDSDATTRVVYTVRRGDNLSTIAQRYGVAVADVRSWNGISGSRIQVGQTLYLYDDNPSKPEASSPVTYQVRRGDTLSEIADAYGVRQADLRRWNNLRSSTIRVGQRLTIHAGTDQAQTIYRVQRGDSLYVIARKLGVTIEDLRRWNSLSSNRLMPGQELKINS